MSNVDEENSLNKAKICHDKFLCAYFNEEENDLSLFTLKIPDWNLDGKIFTEFIPVMRGFAGILFGWFDESVKNIYGKISLLRCA